MITDTVFWEIPCFDDHVEMKPESSMIIGERNHPMTLNARLMSFKSSSVLANQSAVCHHDHHQSTEFPQMNDSVKE